MQTGWLKNDHLTIEQSRINPYSMQKPADNNHNQTDQKHEHGNLVNAMHHAKIEVRTVIGVILTKPVHKNRTQIQPVFQTIHIDRYIG